MSWDRTIWHVSWNFNNSIQLVSKPEFLTKWNKEKRGNEVYSSFFRTCSHPENTAYYVTECSCVWNPNVVVKRFSVLVLIRQVPCSVLSPNPEISCGFSQSLHKGYECLRARWWEYLKLRNEVTGRRKILHNEEIQNLCFSPNIIKR